MTRIRAAATINPPIAVMMLCAAAVHAAPVRTGPAACAVATARVAAHLQRAQSSIPSCDPIRAVDSPRGFYVLALRGRCREPICGSTLIGWYAVEKGSGRVFGWHVGAWKLGPPIG
jgi:hypothetical protein